MIGKYKKHWWRKNGTLNKYNRFYQDIYIYIFVSIQPWCSTEVDDNGKEVDDKWGYCGPDCPTEDDVWLTDDTLTVRVIHHHDEDN